MQMSGSKGRELSWRDYPSTNEEEEEVLSPVINKPSAPVTPTAPRKTRRPHGEPYLLPWEEQPAEYLAARSAEMRRPLMDRAHIHVILHGDHATAHMHRGQTATDPADVIVCFSGKIDPWTCQWIASDLKWNKLPWHASATMYLIKSRPHTVWSVHPNFQFF